MDEFNAVPFLVGLVVAALLGLAAGKLASVAAAGRPLSTNPLTGGGVWAGLLLWLGFLAAAGAGVSYISTGGFWGRNLANLLILALSAADVVFAARAVRVWHNRTVSRRFR